MNERGTRDKNDGNEVMDDCDLPLDLELTERIKVNDETLPYVEEDCDYPEQTEIDKGVKFDFPSPMEMRQSKRGRDKTKYKPYGEDFVVDRIVMDDVMDDLMDDVMNDVMDTIMGLDEIMVSQDIDLINDTETDLLDDRSEPKRRSNMRRNKSMSMS